MAPSECPAPTGRGSWFARWWFRIALVVFLGLIWSLRSLVMVELAASPGIVDLLLTLGADPNTADDGGRTALDQAVASGSMVSVRKLLDAGADPNARDWFGETPLHTAAGACRLDAIRALRLAGSDPSITSQRGQTATDIARERRFDAAVLMLEMPIDRLTVEAE